MPTCPICNEFLATEKAKDHKKHNRQKLHFPCSICGKGQSDAQKLNKHISSAHPPLGPNSTTTCCPICMTLVTHGTKKSSSNRAIEAHNKSQGHFACVFCDKKFASAEALHSHSQALRHPPTSSASQSKKTSADPLNVAATEFHPNPVAQSALDSIVEEGPSLLDKETPLPTVLTSSSDINTSSVSPDSQGFASSSGLLVDNSIIPKILSGSTTLEPDPSSLTLEVETPLPTLTPWYELFVPSQSHSPQSPAGSNSGNDPEVASSWDCSSISDIETPKLAKSSEHPIHSSSKRSEVPPQLTRPSHLTGTNAGIVESSAAPSTSGWVCRVCLDGPTDPVATMCGHVFCHSCITREISNNLQCPVCKKVMLIRLHPLVP